MKSWLKWHSILAIRRILWLSLLLSLQQLGIVLLQLCIRLIFARAEVKGAARQHVFLNSAQKRLGVLGTTEQTGQNESCDEKTNFSGNSYEY
ncbi:MAG: hypothetical protein RBU37_19390 [Myxococcota bacterium]|nr:hypothetical protein [Myxococcota bacterium]